VVLGGERVRYVLGTEQVHCDKSLKKEEKSPGGEGMLKCGQDHIMQHLQGNGCFVARFPKNNRILSHRFDRESHQQLYITQRSLGMVLWGEDWEGADPSGDSNQDKETAPMSEIEEDKCGFKRSRTG
jgi:hypothetical protein